MATKIVSATRRAAAKRIAFLLSTFLVAWGESSTALSILFIGMYPSSPFEFGSDVAFGLLQRISRATRLLPVWLHNATTDRMPESGIMVQPVLAAINDEELCDT